MKKIQMVINGCMERIDNEEIKNDPKGYYIQKNIGLWDKNIKKIYLTNEEVENYIKILNFNNQIEIKNNRVITIDQQISTKRSKSGVIHYIYLNEDGSRIE